jgi:hypothetical protein
MRCACARRGSTEDGSMNGHDESDARPQGAPDLPKGRLAGFIRKVMGRLREGPYAKRVSVGLRRDVLEPIMVPTAQVPVSVRPFVLEDLPWLFPAEDAGGADERADVRWRLRMAEQGALTTHCFVAVDETSNRPCHMQWLTEAGYNAAIRRSGALPVLRSDQVMLENAYTPPRYRGMGVMAAVTALMVERGADFGARSVVAFVDEDNVASLKGACRFGFTPYTIRVRRQYAYGLLRTARFYPVPAGYAFPHGRL